MNCIFCKRKFVCMCRDVKEPITGAVSPQYFTYRSTLIYVSKSGNIFLIMPLSQGMSRHGRVSKKCGIIKKSKLPFLFEVTYNIVRKWSFFNCPISKQLKTSEGFVAGSKLKGNIVKTFILKKILEFYFTIMDFSICELMIFEIN